MNKENLAKIKQYQLFATGETRDPLDEILILFEEICPAIAPAVLRKLHSDIAAYFAGKYPGFSANTSKYHDLRHTYSVALASVRLFHGLFHENRRLPDELVLQGVLSAYFHDTGMLPQTTNTSETGQNYGLFHENRSAEILQQYLRTNHFPDEYGDHCATLIKYTNLDLRIDASKVQDDGLHLCGQVLGTADLLAQMADRYYLEKLPSLFQEHQENGIERHASAVDLMRGTIEFHENIIKTRLHDCLGNLAPVMRTHFARRFGIDKNIYLDNITLNLDYLKKIIKDCALELGCWRKYLKRRPSQD